MTLAPVFRSQSGTAFLIEKGILARMAPHAAAQRAALAALESQLEHVLGPDFRRPVGTAGAGLSDLEFLQDHFFLILFRSVFAELGAGSRLDFYTRLNICIKGIITAADNLFDDEYKELIPLKVEAGKTFGSIMQLMAFDRLLRIVGDEIVASGACDQKTFVKANADLLTALARIGTLEGSEEEGVETIPAPARMVDMVHRVRGGALFSLAFVVPSHLERDQARWGAAESAMARLGTAFQIVDDLTDFEFDLHRASHNLLVSQVTHHGTAEEKAALADLRDRIGQQGEWDGKREAVASLGDTIDQHFSESALWVLGLARKEAREAFEELARIGFWFDPDDSDEVVHAIVGLEGVHRMERLVDRDQAGTRR
jgi:hypothetical protein